MKEYRTDLPKDFQPSKLNSIFVPIEPQPSREVVRIEPDDIVFKFIMYNRDDNILSGIIPPLPGDYILANDVWFKNGKPMNPKSIPYEQAKLKWDVIETLEAVQDEEGKWVWRIHGTRIIESFR